MKEIRIMIVMLWLLPQFSEVSAQATKVQSLEAYFADAPILRGYDSCKKHLVENPQMGIDSVGSRGIYSSLKSRRSNNFPFPDSIPVKVLLSESRLQNWELERPLPYDTASGLLIEGVFGNDKAGRKAHALVYQQLKKELMQYYSAKNNLTGEIRFTKGISAKFPDCTLVRGYSDELDFYFVLIEYWNLQK